ncbi:hypothetical protein CDIOL_28820 [Clostridium diolis]|uniref:Uncharacterized protein n=1 Tax=Clostridium diolis TaxID=223919 RepID=A0AAV3W4P8_9CLOT|nr:hypothetical protein CDIOL_28820 [Clostridium diolis]
MRKYAVITPAASKASISPIKAIPPILKSPNPIIQLPNIDKKPPNSDSFFNLSPKKK